MWSKTMVYSTTSTPDGQTEISIGDDALVVDIDYTELDKDNLVDRYTQLQSFSSQIRSFQILKQKLTFVCFIILPLLVIVASPALLSTVGITASGGLGEQLIWYSSVVASASALLIACSLALIRGYYRYKVFVKLNEEIAAAEKELRRRDIDPNTV